jgi:hypothetical protein
VKVFLVQGDGMRVTRLPIIGGRCALAAACLVLAVGLVGCGGNSKGVTLYTVRGKVLYKGEPAEGADVVFQLKNDTNKDPLRPTGKVRSDGSFLLSTFRLDDGAPAGDYGVLIRWYKEGKVGHDKGKKRGHNVPVDFLQDRYADPASPRFTATVKTETTELSPFEIKE